MQKGDIVLIPFLFTDLSGNKLKPAVVLMRTILDVTLCFITSQFKGQEPSDVLIQPSSSNGLKRPSLIRTSKIATLDISLALGTIGVLNAEVMSELNSKLRQLLQL